MHLSKYYIKNEVASTILEIGIFNENWQQSLKQICQYSANCEQIVVP